MPGLPQLGEGTGLFLVELQDKIQLLMNIGDSCGKMKRHSDMKPELNDLKISQGGCTNQGTNELKIESLATIKLIT